MDNVLTYIYCLIYFIFANKYFKKSKYLNVEGFFWV